MDLFPVKCKDPAKIFRRSQIQNIGLPRIFRMLRFLMQIDHDQLLRTHRQGKPDREIIVIDYKFGEGTPESDERYGRQVSGYMKIFRALGYEKVSGAVWYVVSDKLVTL